MPIRGGKERNYWIYLSFSFYHNTFSHLLLNINLLLLLAKPLECMEIGHPRVRLVIIFLTGGIISGLITVVCQPKFIGCIYGGSSFVYILVGSHLAHAVLQPWAFKIDFKIYFVISFLFLGDVAVTLVTQSAVVLLVHWGSAFSGALMAILLFEFGKNRIFACSTQLSMKFMTMTKVPLYSGLPENSFLWNCSLNERVFFGYKQSTELGNFNMASKICRDHLSHLLVYRVIEAYEEDEIMEATIRIRCLLNCSVAEIGASFADHEAGVLQFLGLDPIAKIPTSIGNAVEKTSNTFNTVITNTSNTLNTVIIIVAICVCLMTLILFVVFVYLDQRNTTMDDEILRSRLYVSGKSRPALLDSCSKACLMWTKAVEALGIEMYERDSAHSFKTVGDDILPMVGRYMVKPKKVPTAEWENKLRTEIRVAFKQSMARPDKAYWLGGLGGCLMSAGVSHVASHLINRLNNNQTQQPPDNGQLQQCNSIQNARETRAFQDPHHKKLTPSAEEERLKRLEEKFDLLVHRLERSDRVNQSNRKLEASYGKYNQRPMMKCFAAHQTNSRQIKNNVQEAGEEQQQQRQRIRERSGAQLYAYWRYRAAVRMRMRS
uniref:Peptidase S54 rhomboid domain-containing protein n=1 Tax=Ditylenchus dipsaci TaxID=166011 RepID=A0A915DTK3_9BILA